MLTSCIILGFLCIASVVLHSSFEIVFVGIGFLVIAGGLALDLGFPVSAGLGAAFMVLSVGLFVLFFRRKTARSTETFYLAGQRCTVETLEAGHALGRLSGALWQLRLEDGTLPAKGEFVEVTGNSPDSPLVLLVRRIPQAPLNKKDAT